MPGRQARTGVDLRRVAAVLLLVAIAAVGLRAGGTFSATGSPGLLRSVGHVLYWTAVVAGIGLVLFDLVVIAAWLLWARRGGTRLPLLPRRRRSPLWLVVLALEVIALAKLAKILGHRAAVARHTQAVAGHPGGGHAHGAHLFLPPGSSWPLLAGLALAAIAAGMLMAPKRRRRPPPPAQPPPEPEAPLLAALTAGAGVLHQDADPRAAIVNCYAAMED